LYKVSGRQVKKKEQVSVTGHKSIGLDRLKKHIIVWDGVKA